MPSIFRSRVVWSWALYDWANSAFATTVLAGFFPIFFKEFWAISASSANTTFQLGLANAGSSLLIALTAPLLGSIADLSQRRKTLLAGFSLTGVVLTAGLFWVGQGQAATALIFFIGATVGFMGANIFYDAMLASIHDEQRDLVSSFGYALGYLGGGVLFAINVAMVLAPDVFGLPDAQTAVRVSFLSVAIWWAVFSLPLLLFVPEDRDVRGMRGTRLLAGAWREVMHTLRGIRQYRVAAIFLLAYWFYIDGVDTIIRMAVDYGRSLGFSANDLIVALLITQFVGFPAALGFGYLGERWGTKRSLFVGLSIYVAVTLWAFFMREVWEFYLLAGVVGLVQGGVQALSRSLYSRLIPKQRSAEFFGFYNMLGKSAALLGPLLVGVVTLVFTDHRLGILSVIILFVIGAYLLRQVNVPDGERIAREQ